MEETLTRRRKVEVKNGARYGGKSGGVWRIKFFLKISDYLTKQQFYQSRKEGRKEGRIVRIGEKVEERWRRLYIGGG